MFIRIFVGLVLMLCLAGCLPRTVVKKNPGPDDTGIRYYRPKPYLFVTPQLKSDGTPTDGMVALRIEMLPDYSEEYSIHVNTGWGQNKTSVTLEDGWKLTQINVDMDSNFDENVKAISDLASKALALSGGGAKSDGSVNVHATNVPIGLYESVIAVGPDCQKHLYGFRYVGFLPFSPCPTTMSGGQSLGCEYDEIYGLFYESGGLVFRPLSEGPGLARIEELEVEASPAADGPATIQLPSVDDGFGT